MTEPLDLRAAEEILEAVHTRRHTAYPAYKPSDIEWLGDVPEHWVVKRLKRSVSSRKGGVWGDEPEDGDKGIICIRVADFDRKSLRVRIENPTYRSIPRNELKGRILGKGDLLLEKSGGGEKQLVGSVMLFDHDVNAVNSNFVARMTPAPDYDSRYLVYLHSWLYSSRINFRSIKQTTGIQNLDSDAYLNEKVAFPPLEEQQAIARFLDEHTRKMDDLIEAKRDLLDLLKEKRQAVITHAVTRGLDPAAKLKPSGVEWLGDVPQHWDMKRLKWDSAVFRGASPRPIDDPIYFDDDGEYAWVRISDVTAAGTYLRETKQRLSDLGASLSVKLAPGDLFLSIAGSVGKPCIAKIKCCIHDGFVYFPRLSCERKFLYYIFASGEPYKGLGKFGTQLNLNTDTVGSIGMAFPPLEEQQSIVRFLDEETQKMDDLESVVREAIEALELLRTSIISAAMTGKIDVRGERT